MQEDLSEMKLLDASITFVGDSFARLFHDILLCYLNSLDDVEVHPIAVPTDCEANMVLYSESEEDCRRKHAILSHSVRNLTTNTAHDISFIWNPFFRTHTITEINKGQQNDYARHVAFDEGEDFLGISEQNFLMERAGKVVLYGTHHWTAKVYRVQRGSDWVYNSTLMNYLKEDAHRTAKKWLQNSGLPFILVTDGTTLDAGTLPLKFSPTLIQKDQPMKYMIESHWCAEFLPWHIIRMVLTLLM